MKTVIMAGGLGKRVREISADLPKPLIRIMDKPILQWQIECLVRQGYTDIILTVSYLAEMIRDYFGDGSRFGCKITYYVEELPIGNAGALFKLWKSDDLDGDFLLLNADSMFDIDFDRMVTYHREHGAMGTIFVHPNDHPYDSGLIICSDEGRVIRWLTKEDERPTWYKNCVNAGIHILNTDLFEQTGISTDSIDGDHKVDLDRDVLKPMSDTGLLYAYKSPEYVKDMGTPERFEQVSEDMRSGLVTSRSLLRPQKAVFLDRDGTINKYVGFLRDINDFEILTGVAEAIRRLNRSGYLIIVITNQPVISRGELTVAELDEIHKKLETLLGLEGAYIDALYYCPHHPDSGFEGEVLELKVECDCRKPNTGLVMKAVERFNIDLSQSWFVGDSWRDVQTGINAGMSTCLIVGEDGGELNRDVIADIEVNGLVEFEEYLMR